MFDGPYLPANEPKRKRQRRQPSGEGWAATRDALVAILVTDLAGFTPLVLRLGDVAAQRVIQAHNRVLRACLATYAGDEIAHTGDGLIATFRSVARALTCAREIQDAL